VAGCLGRGRGLVGRVGPFGPSDGGRGGSDGPRSPPERGKVGVGPAGALSY